MKTQTTMTIEQMVESNDIAGLDDLACKNGMAEARKSLSHSAFWHNIQQPQFARIAATVWGGQVAVLPDASVYKLAQVLSKKAKAKIAISVEVAETPAGQTVYKVGDNMIVTVG